MSDNQLGFVIGEFGTFFSAIESLKTNPELPPVKETPANPSVHIQMPVARPITPKKSALIHSCHLNGPGPCILPVTILTKKSSLSKNTKKPPHPAKVNPAKQLAPKATTNAAPEALPNKPSTTVLEQGKIPRSTPKDNSTDKHLALDAKSNQTQSFKVDEPTIGQPNGRKAIPKQDPTSGTAVRASSAKASLIKMPETYKSSERFAKP